MPGCRWQGSGRRRSRKNCYNVLRGSFLCCVSNIEEKSLLDPSDEGQSVSENFLTNFTLAKLPHSVKYANLPMKLIWKCRMISQEQFYCSGLVFAFRFISTLDTQKTAFVLLPIFEHRNQKKRRLAMALAVHAFCSS